MLALLSGHTQPVRLGRYEKPDVSLGSHRHRRLLVGDAKSTETSGRAETLHQLRSYASAATAWRRVGFVVRFVLCTGYGDPGWRALLADLDPSTTAVHVAPLDASDRLAWVDLLPIDGRGAAARRHPGHLIRA